MRVIAPGLDLVELAAVRMQAAGCVMCGITSRPPCTPVAHRGHGTPEPRDQSLYAMWRWGIPIRSARPSLRGSSEPVQAPALRRQRDLDRALRLHGLAATPPVHNDSDRYGARPRFRYRLDAPADRFMTCPTPLPLTLDPTLNAW